MIQGVSAFFSLKNDFYETVVGNIISVSRYGCKESLKHPSWLNPDITELEQIMPVLNTSTLNHRVSWRVADAVKNLHNAYPELLTPVSEFEGRGKHQAGIE